MSVVLKVTDAGKCNGSVITLHLHDLFFPVEDFFPQLHQARFKKNLYSLHKNQEQLNK